MAQLSRPLQIALAAVVLLGGVWLFALKGGSSSSSRSSSSSSPAPAASSSSSSSSASASSGSPSAPGVAGLTRAIEKAHGAVATSQQNAHQLERKSQEASSNSAPSAGGTSAPSTHAGSSPSASGNTSTPSRSSSHHASKAAGGAPAKQRLVESEVKAGDVVVLLFWDHKGADDVAVHRVVTGLAGPGVAVHVATPNQVAAYGTVTRGVQVYGTPTTLVVGEEGSTNVITGLTDEYSLRQAISEARRG